MILTIDVGNTRIKSAVFENDTLIDSLVFLTDDFKNTVENILNKHNKITVLVISSVGKLDKKEFEPFLNSVKIHFSVDEQGSHISQIVPTSAEHGGHL